MFCLLDSANTLVVLLLAGFWSKSLLGENSAEFRPKSLQESACTISSVTYAEFCMQSFGRNPRIMLRAEIRPKRQQIYGRNLHIILLQTLGRSLCRLIHAECFAKSWVVYS